MHKPKQVYGRQGHVRFTSKNSQSKVSLARYFGLRAFYQRAAGNDLAALHDARAALTLRPSYACTDCMRKLHILMANIYYQHGCYVAMGECLEALHAMPYGGAGLQNNQEVLLEFRYAIGSGNPLAMHRALAQVPLRHGVVRDTICRLERCLLEALLANAQHDDRGMHTAYHEALPLLKGYSRPHDVRRYHQAFSRLLLSHGDTVEARSHLCAAYKAIKADRLDVVDALVIKQLARLQGAQGAYREAVTTLESHQQGLDSMQRKYMADVLTQRSEMFTQQHALAEKFNANLQANAMHRQQGQNRHLIAIIALLALSLVYTTFHMSFRRIKKTHRQRELIKQLSARLNEESDVSARVQALLERQEKSIEQHMEIQKYSLSMLSAHNTQLETSINYVHNLQHSLLPGEAHLQSVFGDCFLVYRPRDVVSGDCFWYAQAPTHTILAMVDCAGHGIPGALMSFVAITLLRKVVCEWGLSDPAEILQTMHSQLRSYLREERNNLYGLHSMDVAMVKWIPSAQRLIFSGASSNIYVQQHGEIKRYRGDLMSIGSTLVDRHYVDVPIPIPDGCELYMTTDGLSDQLNIHSKKLGYNTMMALLGVSSGEPMAMQKEHLWHLFESHRGTAEQTDDVCFFGIKIPPQA